MPACPLCNRMPYTPHATTAVNANANQAKPVPTLSPLAMILLLLLRKVVGQSAASAPSASLWTRHPRSKGGSLRMPRPEGRRGGRCRRLRRDTNLTLCLEHLQQRGGQRDGHRQAARQQAGEQDGAQGRGQGEP